MDYKVAVIGLGYVGLPLAVEFATRYDVVGYDADSDRIRQLRDGVDSTKEISGQKLREADRITFTDEPAGIAACNFLIIAVPTPIDEYKRPDLSLLISASRTVGKVLKKGDIVIYESTVYPGCTEEQCVPALEAESGLTFNVDFFCGYSPERINPGDREHTIEKITKITSGSTPEAAEIIDRLYGSIIKAGTFRTSSIKVAEASKVIENAQRDINIAFVNELAIIFELLGLDTAEVLEAASTKWNFLPFRPGLVGGHCIGVDPYYLTHKAENVGYHPQVILSGRRINDNMGKYVASQFVKLLASGGIEILNARVLILGITFKENCPDIRNSKVIDIVKELGDYGIVPEVFDPNADRGEVLRHYGISLIGQPEGKYDGIIHAVAHDAFRTLDFAAMTEKSSAVFDVKSTLPREIVGKRL